MVNNHTVHPYPTRLDVTVHMNAMMPIHIFNFNGSYTIMFHIIQTIILTHQLACINISFCIHISSHSIQTITCKQNTWTNFNPIINLDFLTVPEQYMSCPWTAPSSSIGPFLGTGIYGNFRPHNTQNHFHGLLDKEYPSRRRPLPLRVVETPQYRYPRVALAVGINFASCPAGIRCTDC